MVGVSGATARYEIGITSRDAIIAQRYKTIDDLHERLNQYEWVCPCGNRVPLSSKECPDCGTINIE